MQTFLPNRRFDVSASCLDNQRLGKQRVEVLQLVRCIAYDTKGWQNHPATIMWRPYLDCLIYYGMSCCRMWQRRGFNDTVWTSLYMMLEVPYDEGMKNVTYPPWLGSHKFHSSHRSNLLRKDLKHYKKLGWTESAWQEYFWPTPDYNWQNCEDDKCDDWQSEPISF